MSTVKLFTNFFKHLMNPLHNRRISYKLIPLVLLILYIIYANVPSFKQRSHHGRNDIADQQSLVDKPKVTVYFGGRTGNFMFQYASLIGISHRNKLIPIIPASNDLWNIFKLPIYSGELKDYVKITQKLSASYEEISEGLEPKDTYLQGYWQSWKYFNDIKDELLSKHFVFLDNISQEADLFILNAIKSKHKPGASIIGVHARMGDFARRKSYGYNAAPVSYYYKAMNYFRRKYSNVLFIVITNDVYWAEQNLDQGPDVFYSHNTPDKSSLDLAILSKCNHTVITSGTFSWWAGYLAGGDVVYYHGYPPPNTHIGRDTILEDYYPSKWVPL